VGTRDIDAKPFPRLTRKHRLQLALFSRIGFLVAGALQAASLSQIDVGGPPWPEIALLQQQFGAPVTQMSSIQATVQFISDFSTQRLLDYDLFVGLTGFVAYKRTAQDTVIGDY